MPTQPPLDQSIILNRNDKIQQRPKLGKVTKKLRNMIFNPNGVYRAENAILARWLDGDNQSFGLKLLLIKLGPFLVSGQEQGDSGVVGFDRT